MNSVAGRLCLTFPFLLNYWASDSHRGLSTHLPPNVIPLSWKTNRPLWKVRSHLLVDALANLARPILRSLSCTPLANASLLSENAGLPSHDTMTNAYRTLTGRTKLLLLEEWKSLAPPRPYYTFPLSLTPDLFMGLGKFIAGRIHQMRAQKCYPAAHPLWSRLDEPKHCPRCCKEVETLSHAILRCWSTSYHRECLLQGPPCVGSDPPLWTNKDLFLALAAFIRATGTNYLSDMFLPFPPHQTQWSFHSH